MSFSKQHKQESRSRKSTEQDSGSQADEELCCKTIPHKHKTELCKTFSELGYCPYQSKCRFAHGKQELVAHPPKPLSKNRKCNGFWKNGCCPYGSRCQFGHAEIPWHQPALLMALQTLCLEPHPAFSRLLPKIL